MAEVEIRDIRKNYGGLEIIHGVNIEIPDGKFVVLVGPSGCGKSTLLRMVAGLESIGDGDIVIGGRVVNDVLPKDRDIAMVFQNYALYPHMTVADNMSFSLRLRRTGKEKIANEIGNAAQVLGLKDLLSRYPRQLSGGQRQRVAMGRAIVRSPSVFLFDEPLSNLDAKLRVQMRTEIKELHQRLGTTTIYVTHDQIEAMTMADQIVVMRSGVVEQMGEPLEIYENPANLFVAEFIGSPSMNFVPGTVERTEGKLALLTEERLSLPLGANAATLVGRRVVCGIRPEHLEVSGHGTPGIVKVVEPTGPETQVFVDVGKHKLVVVINGRFRGKPGEQINLLPDTSQVHLFDTDSGERLTPDRPTLD